MNYKEPTAQAFVKAMEAANFEVQHYHGRFSFEGPSVTVQDRHGLVRAIQAAPRELAEVLQWDNMGRTGFVLYGPHGKDPEEK